MTSPNPSNIILYHYSYSPYAHKISYYLSLRNIPYHQVPQPPILPRPDLSNLLGIIYRRIPVLAIGNTVFINTPLILETLETKYPTADAASGTGPALGGGEEAKEWGRWSDKVFRSAVACLPTSLPVMKDPKFRNDREDFSGSSYQPDKVDANRAKALRGVEEGFKGMEEVLKDGRDWVLGGKEVSLGDVNAVWVLEWMINLPGALAGSNISKETYPKTFAWVGRFMAKVGKKRVPKISAQQAKEVILSEQKEDFGVEIQGGGLVKVAPTDTGKNHPQVGVLRKRENGKIVLEVMPPNERRTLKVVFPEEGFEVKEVARGEAKL
ncbi:hypothetical protein FPQ18DRAFT_376764 [Pyronema domesticum]|uniref:GST N-terminal domain-containing protein n=1 Tax=Pyronema omphalodes (strain CBS 100304) TaxID=1076935 RepID=U4LBX2_PYROM|nr:hypothetical protein FPQ18DRAFT_376764 [Pyronema domesticum]CCX29604.1 Similar to hypothetical protein [Tuber melanosporum Mel28]; acc. no. XP_002836873 [Pyronema omphalodes CBS 100304]